MLLKMQGNHFFFFLGTNHRTKKVNTHKSDFEAKGLSPQNMLTTLSSF